MKRHERLKLVVPLTALIIFVLIFLSTRCTQHQHVRHDKSASTVVFPNDNGSSACGAVCSATGAGSGGKKRISIKDAGNDEEKIQILKEKLAELVTKRNETRTLAR